MQRCCLVLNRTIQKYLKMFKCNTEFKKNDEKTNRAKLKTIILKTILLKTDIKC